MVMPEKSRRPTGCTKQGSTMLNSNNKVSQAYRCSWLMSSSPATTSKPSVECTSKVGGVTSGECVPLSSKR